MGTGICVSDSVLGNFFVTCKHVVADDSGKFYAMARFFVSDTLQNGTVYSTPRYIEIDLHPERGGNVAEFPAFIDLVGIFVFDKYTRFSEANLHYTSYKSQALLTRNRIQQLARPGTEVEVIGFELNLPGSKNYYFSRFGHVSLYPGDFIPLPVEGESKIADFMFLDLSARAGDSGGPVFVHSLQGTHLVGIMSFVNESHEFSIVYPIWYIRLMTDLATRMRK